ncbi:MAG: aldo/keto reductase [Candidatus Acidiferrales bacterium]
MAAENSLTPGFATLDGTRRFAARFEALAAAGHFRERQGLIVSSIGIGTYLGEPDAATDMDYREAIVAAVWGGVNVIDSAINYRMQRSERSVGAALRTLSTAGFARDGVVVCTKAGFLTPDGEMPADPNAYFYREFISKEILSVDDIAAGCHCIAPRYIEDQIERSRRNLGLSCIDVFYLHNPETQLSEVSRDVLHGRIAAAFEVLESAVAAGKIRAYGLATWNAFRDDPRAQGYLSLEAICGLASQVAGNEHHFRFVQLPFNIAMPEALIRPNQIVGGKTVSTIQAARELGIALVASASLLQTHLVGKISPSIHTALGLRNDIECALQFVRSAPGISTALVGMKRVDHVKANLKLAGIPPVSQEQFRRIFTGPQ